MNVSRIVFVWAGIAGLALWLGPLLTPRTQLSIASLLAGIAALICLVRVVYE